MRILNATGRQVRRDKPGAVPKDLASLLQRVGMANESWVDTVTNLGRWFHRAAGRVSLLVQAAARAQKHGFQGVARCRQAFA